MVNSYEELVGAVGRAQQFRRRRYGASDIFNNTPPRLFFDDREFDLKDISGSGAGASMRGDAETSLVDVNSVGVLRLMQHGEEIFRGPARCARSEFLPGRIFTGFTLHNDQFDLAELRKRNAIAAVKSEISLDNTAEVSSDYRAFCSDTLAFVGAHSMRINRLMAPIEAAMSASDKREIFDELVDSVSSDWRAILLRGNEFALSIREDKNLLAAMKRYTEAAVTPALIGGASWNRSYYKPMGYPGDFRIMNYMYDQRPEGDTVRAQFLHGLGIIAGRPIHTRMLTLSQVIAEHFENKQDREPQKIASIGCGPARELEHIISTSSCRGRFEATLIDQEVEALEYAVNYARARCSDSRLGITALNTSFKSMFNPSGIDALRDKDVIYSLGLVDYFSPLLARRFVSRAYELVRPGGKVIIGNASDSLNGTYWAMEHALDWSLFFRSRDEMNELAADAVGAKVSVEADPLDSIYFLVVEKPA